MFAGLDLPTSVEFAADGRVFVAEKSGLIKVFEGLGDERPDVFADLRLNVNDYWDRGLLGLALDPEFPTDPYVYVLYTHDAEVGGTAPRWGTAAGGDGCPDPPGGFKNGCVVSGRLSRLTAGMGPAENTERILVEDWCQQFWSHSVGDLAFAPDGSLFASAGDGASASMADYGQAGDPPNPCGDPPGGVLTPPAAEGGALRSQDLRSTADPLGLSGSVIRINPETGFGVAANPLAAAGENHRRLVAHGFRNPFRITVHPRSGDLWVGDVGWNAWEEINSVPMPATPGFVPNYGWPCFEGSGTQRAYASLGLTLCGDLYSQVGSTVGPVSAYPLRGDVTEDEDCLRDQGSSISGLEFYDDGGYPDSYDGALFFADYARRCIWLVPADENGRLDPQRLEVFEEGAGSAVDIERGFGGDLFYVDIAAGSIHQIRYFEGNRPPSAKLTADRTYGALPLTVQLDAGGSVDPDGDGVEFAWDLDGDGGFDDGSGSRPEPMTFEEDEDRRVSVRVTDTEGAADTATTTIRAGNSPPTASIETPLPGARWSVGSPIRFSGTAEDPQEGVLPATSMTWSMILQHCPSACHEHFTERIEGASGSVPAPEHEYPARVLLRLTVRDSGGLQDVEERVLEPHAVVIHAASDPAGALITAGSRTQQAPFDAPVIQGSRVQVSASATVAVGGGQATFSHWLYEDVASTDRTLVFRALTSSSLRAVYEAPDANEPDPPDPWIEPLPCLEPVSAKTTLRRDGIHARRSRITLRGSARLLTPCGNESVRARVYVYIARRTKGGCRFLTARGRFAAPRPCSRVILLPVSGFSSFRRTVSGPFRPGRYLAGSAAFAGGFREPAGRRNRVSFRFR